MRLAVYTIYAMSRSCVLQSVVAYGAMQAMCGLFKAEFLGVMLVTYGALLINSLLALRYISQKAARDN